MEENAIIHEELDVLARVVNLKEKGFISSINGHMLFLKVILFVFMEIMKKLLNL